MTLARQYEEVREVAVRAYVHSECERVRVYRKGI